MRDRTLVDTNVLVYAHDPSDRRKQQLAIEALDSLVEQGLGVLTTQVLGEFISVVTKKIPQPLSTEDAARQAYALMESFEVLCVDARTVAEAIRGQSVYSLPYWDAQVWASARIEHIPVVLSEDFAHGEEIEGVTFVDPFE